MVRERKSRKSRRAEEEDEYIEDVTPDNANVEEEEFENDEISEEIVLDDLTGIDESANNGGNKPIFNTNTKAVVTDVKLNRMFDTEVDKNGTEYHKIIVKITCETKKGEVTKDNYSGIRETDKGLWCGNKSAMGKLRNLILGEIGKDATWEEVFDFLSQEPEVKIRTETTSFGGKDFEKNIINQFI